jgi:hypothetical protein
MKISIMGSGDKIVMGGGDVDSEVARGQKNRLKLRRHKQKVKKLKIQTLFRMDLLK